MFISDSNLVSHFGMDVWVCYVLLNLYSTLHCLSFCLIYNVFLILCLSLYYVYDPRNTAMFKCDCHNCYICKYDYFVINYIFSINQVFFAISMYRFILLGDINLFNSS